MLFFCKRVKVQVIHMMPLKLRLRPGTHTVTCTHALLAESSHVNRLKDKGQRSPSDHSTFMARVWM